MQVKPDAAAGAYLPHVDGLRALAVALVVTYHAWPSLVPGGFIGVDVFFVISGYIITRQIAQEMQAGRFSYVGFLARRVRRLAPAAFACFAVSSVLAAVFFYPKELSEFAESLVAASAMVANVYFWRDAGYFSAPAFEKPLLHTWSLAVEDQFYLVWPLLLWLLMSRLRNRAAVIAAVGVLAVASLVHAEWAANANPEYAFYMFPARACELLLGCELALGADTLRRLPHALVESLAVAGLVAIGASARLLNESSVFPGLSAVPACLGTAACILGGLARPTLSARTLALRPVVALGAASYSLYLWHWPLLVFARHVLERVPAAAEAAAIVASSLVLAGASWRWIERPFRGANPILGLRSERRTYAVLAAAVVAVSAFAGAILLSRGWPERYEAPVRDFFAALSTGNGLRSRCDGNDHALIRNETCNFGRPKEKDQSFDIAIFGDSNADHFVPMLGVLAKERGLSGRQVTYSACAPLIGASRRRHPREEAQCRTHQEMMLKFLDRNPGLKLAVLSGVWANYYANVSANPLAAASADGTPPSFEFFARTTIETFRRRGIKVLLLDQIPFFEFEAFRMSCFIAEARTGTPPEDCRFERAQASKDIDRAHAYFEKAARDDAGVSAVDFRPLLCGEVRCSGFKDGLFLYRDRGHLNGKGSALLAKYVALPALD